MNRARANLAAAGLACVALSACDDARTTFQECTVGVSQAVSVARDEQDRRRNELLYASACMFDHGYTLDAEQQREDAVKHRLRELHTYWIRR